MTVVLADTIHAQEGERDALVDLFRRVAPLSRAEPGCVRYDANEDPGDAHRFFVFEQYVDEAAFAAHRGSPHFQEIVIPELLPRIASMERLTLLPLV